MVGLPIRLGAVTRNDVPHRIQICLREMGLHQSHRVLYSIPGRSLYDGLQLATGRLQPLRQALGSRLTLGLERPEQSLQRAAQAIQHRPALGHLILRFYRKALGYVSPSNKNHTHPTAV